jgi:hypothetical protein
MPSQETAELTTEQRGILATNASAADLDEFSKRARRTVDAYEQPVLTPRKRTYYSRGQTWYVEWQDYGQPLPAWFDPLLQGFIDLRTLPPDWDSYGAGLIDPKLVDAAMAFANGLLGAATPAPRVVPLSSGGLQMEWHRKGIDLEIVFDREEPPFFSYRNRMSGEEAEHALPEGRQILLAILKDLE